MKLKELVIQNFKSFSNKRTIIRFDDFEGLTLIMGQNNDSPDENAKNGCGKSSLFDALCYVLTGKPIKAVDKPAALVNRSNKKAMKIILDFELNGYDCRIIRGMKPGVCKFYKKPLNADGSVDEDIYDVTKDSIRNTAADIIEFTGMDRDVFMLVVVTAAKTDNFFDMDATSQKSIVETLFGYSVLTKKGEALKLMRKERESDLALEKAKVEERIAAQERDKKRLEALEQQLSNWENNRNNKIVTLEQTIAELEPIDFDKEATILNNKSNIEHERKGFKSLVTIAESNLNNHIQTIKAPIERKLKEAEKKVRELKDIDIDSFLKAYDEYTEEEKRINSLKTDLDNDLKLLRQFLAQFNIELQKLKKEVAGYADHCPTCGQEWPDQSLRQSKIDELNKNIASKVEESNETNTAIETLMFERGELDLNIRVKPSQFVNRDMALRAASDLDNARQMVKTYRNELIEAETKENELEEAVLTAQNDFKKFEESISSEEKQTGCFGTFEELSECKALLEQSRKQLIELKEEDNPYLFNVETLKNDLAEDIDTSSIIAIEEDIKDHTDLINLLTKKDSPIRKDVTATKLPALNKYVSQYLDELNLPYVVRFNDDLSASIFDFDDVGNFSTLSSGEEERVGLALSWAFRDVFESMNYPINFFGIDERIDAGLDGSGSQRAISILYEMAVNRKRNIFLISHREEMVDFVDRVMIMVKENKFTHVEMQ